MTQQWVYTQPSRGTSDWDGASQSGAFSQAQTLDSLQRLESYGFFSFWYLSEALDVLRADGSLDGNPVAFSIRMLRPSDSFASKEICKPLPNFRHLARKITRGAAKYISASRVDGERSR
jgi:hypothetical protein